MPTDFYIIIDASFCPRTRMAVLGVAFLSDSDLASGSLPHITTKTISCLGSSRGELLASLWAMDLFYENHGALATECNIHLVSDCQTILKLPVRRSNLENRGFKSRRTGEPLRNADLYREFFQSFDALHLNLIWRKGHDKKKNRDQLGLILSHVDLVTRRQLRSLEKSKL